MRKVCEWYLQYKEVSEERRLRNEAELKAKKEGEEIEKEDNEGDDNILKALLKYRDDEACLEFMGYYSTFLDQELLLEALSKNNSTFVRKSLLVGAFDKQFFSKDEVVE